MRHHPGSGSQGTGRIDLGFGQLYASAGDHIGHFYEDAAEGLEILVSFLKAGLQGQDKCVCLVGPSRRCEELQAALGAAGVDWRAAIDTEQLLLDSERRTPEELQGLLRETSVGIPGRYPLLRWAGVMSWVIDMMPTTDILMRYEAQCNTVDPVVVFLCQYELGVLRGDVVMAALKTHPISIVGGAVHSNPYFVAPEVVLNDLPESRISPA